MEPTSFDEANSKLDSPDGDVVSPLICWRGEYADGAPGIVTCWKPTRTELDEIERTGRVWVTVLGTKSVPMYLTGFCPFEK